MASKKPDILIVDDNLKYAENIKTSLTKLGNVDLCLSEDEFYKLFKPYKYDLILLDLRLREGQEGLMLLEYIKQEDSISTVVIISEYGDIGTAVESMQRGAKNFLPKAEYQPDDIFRFAQSILKESALERRVKHLEIASEKHDIIGRSANISNLKELITIAGKKDFNTLITGEIGVGKKTVARAIKENSRRREGLFVEINLDQNPSNIVSELFGMERGQPSTQHNHQLGLFEKAHKGVLYLNNIENLPQRAQASILNALNYNKYTRVGGQNDICIDVQIIAASTKLLKKYVQKGLFSEGLYYHLCGLAIDISPLRQRLEDIPILAEYFLEKYKLSNQSAGLRFSDNAISAMMNYHWPQNISELQHVIRCAASVCIHNGLTEISSEQTKQFFFDQSRPDTDILRELAEYEFQRIEYALRRTNGRKQEAQNILGYKSRRIMQSRIKKLCEQYKGILDSYPIMNEKYGKYMIR